MQQHVKIFAILNLVLGGICLLVGVIALAFFGGIAGLVLNEDTHDAMVGSAVVSLIGAVILMVMLVMSLPMIITGIGLLNYRPWARILGIVVCAIHLIGFPLGTAFAAYGLWVLLSQQGTALFRAQPA
jgi:hypothetical protein